MRVFYLPLEAYQERYTESLAGWTIGRFSANPKMDVTVVEGNLLPGGGEIKTGAVLDAHGRSYWSATQIAALVATLRRDGASSEDVIYMDDMFTPGYEAIPYILSQTPASCRPKLFARNHAQSVDPDDFTFRMRAWMRPYEEMLYASADGVICASSAHAEAMKIAMLDQHRASIHVLGLPYDHNAVRSLYPAPVLPLDERPLQVIYCSRFDAEKQPHLFMDIVEASDPQIKFVMCTGGLEVRSSATALERLSQLERSGRVHVLRGCTKSGYYEQLANSRVQLNTARQDYISYTAIEASSFGTPTLAPAFRAFPQTLRNNLRHLFVPWSLEDAVAKLDALVMLPQLSDSDGWLAKTQHATLDRIAALFNDDHPIEQWWLVE